MNNQLLVHAALFGQHLAEAFQLRDRLRRYVGAEMTLKMIFLLIAIALAIVADSFVGWTAVLAALEELTEDEPDAALAGLVSLMLSAMLVLSALAADVGRATVDGAKRVTLTVAALSPTLLVLALVSCYLSGLWGLSEEDEVASDAMLKYLVPAVISVIAHLVVFATSDQLEAALRALRRRFTTRSFDRTWKRLRGAAHAVIAARNTDELNMAKASQELLVLQGGQPTDRPVWTATPDEQKALFFAHLVLEPRDPFTTLAQIEALNRAGETSVSFDRTGWNPRGPHGSPGSDTAGQPLNGTPPPQIEDHQATAAHAGR